ncbi:MAG: aminopeptidase P family protein [Acidobacteria bacterium]|nr:aminopeptidase P family protein [Acidobacteriota bacterium]
MPHAPTAALERRHDAVRSALASRSLDALIVTSLSNIAYLTNFAGSSAVAVVTLDHLYFITDFRYVTAVTDERSGAAACPGLDLVVVDSTYDAALLGVLTRETGRVGFEAAHLTVSRHGWLAASLGTAAARELVPTEGLIERLRVVKDGYELATMREAGRRISGVARELLADVSAGRTELEVALAIDARIRRAGFSRTAFETIVASGPNAALPHARPGERRLAEGDLVVLDFGGVYDSYCVDLTRTVSIGPASPRARDLHAAVLEAQTRAIRAVAPAASRFAIDAAARDLLTVRGFGEAFGHGTGHGLGLEVHEDPRLTRRRAEVDASDEALRPGMVFTIEPGVYLPGWGGIRIEDDVVVTEQGAELITDAGRELLEA